MNSFFKQPDEIVPVSIDFTDAINSTETITSLIVTAATLLGIDVTATIIDDDSISGDICKAVIKSGTSGTKYKITMKAITSEGNLYEEDLILSVLSI